MADYTWEAKIRIVNDWKAKIKQWRESNLSATAWCKLNDVNYQQFKCWKNQLTQGDGKTFHSDSFIELSDIPPQSSFAGIEIIFDDFSIRLSKEFDCATFQQCLRSLRGFKC